MKSKKSKNPNKYLIGSIFSPPFPITFAKMLKFDRSLYPGSTPSTPFNFSPLSERPSENLDHEILKITIDYHYHNIYYCHYRAHYLSSSQLFLHHFNGLRGIQIAKMVKLPSSQSIGHQLFLSLFNFFLFFFLFTVSSPPPHLPPQSSSYRFLLFPLLILGPLPLLPPLSLPRRVFTSPSLVLELVHLRVYSR